MISLNTAYDTREQVHVSQNIWHLLGLWLMLRVATSLWVALISPLFPATLREQRYISIALALAWPRMRISYRIYAVLVALVSFGYYTGPHMPYMGLPRHLLLAFPIFIGPGSLIRHPWVRLPIVIVELLSIFFLLLQYTVHGWVPQGTFTKRGEFHATAS
jgi:hypothetical protein